MPDPISIIESGKRSRLRYNRIRRRSFVVFHSLYSIVENVSFSSHCKIVLTKFRASRRRNGNAIRGPQSALTDFLASHNISAQQINLDYQARVQQAQQAEAAAAAAAAADEDKENEDEEDAAEIKKRKRKEEKAIAKLKQSKDFKKRKLDHRIANPDAESDDDALARDMLKKPTKAPPKPGQLANCELCEKRFTVTAYTLAGPDGGLLCTKCGKELKDEKKKAEAAEKKKAPKAPRGRAKRQAESDRLMGDVKPGAKSLVEHCVSKVADVVNDIEEFGDLPQSLLDRLSQILSKKRVLTPRTLQLFLQPKIDRIAVYDCAKLETEDFDKIFAFMPDVERVNLRMAGQMKDHSLRYMIEKCPKITHLQLGATNLISDEAWLELFLQRGSSLRSLKLSELNDAMKDDTVQVLAESCTNLKRLKLKSCPHMTEASLNSLCNLKGLEHLSIGVAQQYCTPEALIGLIASLGPTLQTLSLSDYAITDDTVLEAIKTHCKSLTKLRLTGSICCTDAMFASLLDKSWRNPGLSHVDLNSDRDIDGQGPDDDDQMDTDAGAVGFGSNALRALFSHSGRKLEKLDLHSCRDISLEALMEVFDGKKQYPHLSDMDLSFVKHIDETVMAGIFKSCPSLTKLAVFGCFSAREARIPPGVAVIGLPNAQDAVEIMVL